MLLCLLAVSFTIILTVRSQCGYEGCDRNIKNGLLNVHLVPHTHDDVGWLKNVDEYYYGAKDNIQRAGVKYILDSVIDELLKNDQRKFIYVEIAFFKRWWDEQDEAVKGNVKKLVEEGRLVFTNGGWVMNDEACTHYNAIIDQMTLGLRFLNNTFGKCARPLSAWHIDPFGHSKEQANLFSMMGFDSFFFSRIDYQDRIERLKTKRMEEIWSNRNSHIFIGMFYEFLYGPPTGFCFDGVLCQDEPIMDDERLEGYNVDKRVDEFLHAVQEHAKYYRTNHIMMLMGNDFQYMLAKKWFDNLDKLIKYTNNKSTRVNLLYSTPQCYAYQLSKTKTQFSVKTDDFFPYASDWESYWTGYFTSRPSQKRLIRKSNNLLQLAKQIQVRTKMKSISDAHIDALSEAMAVNQHHDAVTGTEKQAVMDDYVKRLSEGTHQCQNYIAKALNIQLFSFCDYRNISVCNISELQAEFYIISINSLARSITKYLTIPVQDRVYKIFRNEHEVASSLSPIDPNVNRVRRSLGNASNLLTFKVSLKGLSYEVYKVNSTSRVLKQKQVDNHLKSIENEYYKVWLGNDGKLKAIHSKLENISRNIKQDILWYEGVRNYPHLSSGAYVFLPNGTEPHTINNASVPLKIIKNPLVQEVRQTFSKWATQTIKLYKDMNYIEFEWIIGPIPINDNKSKEIITRFNTDIDSKDSFFTDANGRQILERRRHYRKTWKLNNTEPVSGNYYPVNSRIYIKDETAQFTILNDRSQGGTSLKSGEVELMLHRRDLSDDGFGVQEPLNETGQYGDGLIIAGKHYVLLTSPQQAAKQHRLLAEEIFMDTQEIFTPNVNTIATLPSHWLPKNIHLLTLELLSENEVLLRVEHQFDIGENPKLSAPTTIDISKIFDEPVSSVEELALGGNVYINEIKPLDWNFTKSVESLSHVSSNEKSSKFVIELKPMDIKTFIVYLDN